MIALTARLNERDETIIQLQEELDAYERIHRETECLVDKKQERILQLEQVMLARGVAVPPDEEGTDRAEAGGEQSRKYPPYEQLHLDGEDNDDVPLQLLTADEKVEELTGVLGHKESQIEQLQVQLRQAIRPEQIKERVEQIVQREVEERVRHLSGDSGSSLAEPKAGQAQQQQLQYVEKKLKISEEKNEALKNLLSSKDEEIERVL